HFFGGWVVKQSIDSEITPQNVLLRICEHDAGRTPPIDIGLIGSKCRYFEWTAPMNDENNPELRSDAFGTGKDFDDLLRPGTGRDVVIRRFQTHHHVANTATDKVGFVSSLAKLANDGDRRIRFHCLK